jgi:hypothetical protein
MPQTPGIITADQLRSEVGSPTADPREAAAVTDTEFQSLIDRVSSHVERKVLNRLEKRLLESAPPSATQVLTEVEVSLTPDTLFAKGQLPTDVYPLTYESGVAEGKNYAFDSDLEASSVGYFTRRRFRFIGNTVIVIPKDTEGPITLRLPDKEKTNATVGADLIEQANARIKEQAVQMVQRKAQVGADLEQPDMDQ